MRTASHFEGPGSSAGALLANAPIRRQARDAAHAGSYAAFMTASDLATLYRHYIDCLNAQDWARLGDFVHRDVRRNGVRLGLAGYRDMLETDFAQIPDLRFVIDFLVSEPPRVASRLVFECTPEGTFMGLAVNGRRIAFAENVFYEVVDQRIRDVWSVIDKAAIETQL